MSLAHWALVGIVVVSLLAAAYAWACNKAIESLDWEDENE